MFKEGKESEGMCQVMERSLNRGSLLALLFSVCVRGSFYGMPTTT